MAFNSNINKVLQVSEQAAPPINVPFAVGNQLYMLTQQDVRRTEDIRHLTYKRMPSYGQMPVAATPNLCNIGLPATNFGTMQNLISHCQQQPVPQCSSFDQDVHMASSDNGCSISKQLEWSKQYNSQSSAPYPLSYSKATSTHTLRRRKSLRLSQRSMSCQASQETASKACNTECWLKSRHDQACTTDSEITLTKKPSKVNVTQPKNQCRVSFLKNSVTRSTNTEPIRQRERRSCYCQTNTQTISKSCNTDSSIFEQTQEQPRIQLLDQSTPFCVKLAQHDNHMELHKEDKQ